MFGLLAYYDNDHYYSIIIRLVHLAKSKARDSKKAILNLY